MQQELERILQLQRKYSSKLTPQMKERGELIRTAAAGWLEQHANSLSKAMGLAPDDFLVKGSNGAGSKALVPWVRFASQARSPKANKGFYVVYLFDAPGNTVFLSLNQGTSQGEGMAPQPTREIKARTSWAQAELQAWIASRQDELTINLRGGALGDSYELGNIAAVAYRRGRVPDDKQLLRDARIYATALGQIYSAQEHATGPLPGEAPEVDYAEEVADAAAGKRRRRRSGAGFRTNASEIKVIEKYAIGLAIHYYEAQGWAVKELGKPFDLELKKDGQTLHIEVKGTVSEGGSVALTYNEVAHHKKRRPANALVVVCNIKLDRSSSQPTASGGTLYELRDWSIDARRLKPISYKYIVPDDLYNQPGIQAELLKPPTPRT
jgi:hypothetical protein